MKGHMIPKGLLTGCSLVKGPKNCWTWAERVFAFLPRWMKRANRKLYSERGPAILSPFSISFSAFFVLDTREMAYGPLYTPSKSSSQGHIFYPFPQKKKKGPTCSGRGRWGRRSKIKKVSLKLR